MSQRPATSLLGEAISRAWQALAARLRPWLPILVACWLVGISFCSLRPLVGWLILRRLRTVGVSAGGQVLEDSGRRIAARLRIRHTVTILRSALAQTPLVVGYLRPVLLVPVAMVSQLPLAELEAILAHELAHIRRHDFLVNLWQTTLETVFFYHPAVWSLSHRLRAEREHCCDDVALSIVGDPVCYGWALLHVEELRGPDPLLALSAAGGSLLARIQRLFGQPTPPASAASIIAGLLLPGAVLASVLAAFALDASGIPDPPETSPKSAEKARTQPLPKSKPGRPKPAAAARSLDIIIAQHVIVWDGRIRTWDEVVKELREIRTAQGKPIHPHFYFTNGAHSVGHWDTYKAKAYEVYKELFEPAGMSLGSISPRAGPRYDVLKMAEDLVPDPKSLRSGVVVEKGKPMEGVLVVLAPEEGLMPIVLKPDLTLRDRHDEVWTITGPDGRFNLPVEPVHAIDKLTEPPTYALAAISPTGYALAAVPPVGVEVSLELLPLARVELTPVEGKPQQVSLAFWGGLPDQSPGYTIYEIDLADKPLSLALPPGKIVVRRTYKHEDGGAKSYPAETVRPVPGGSEKVKLPNITEEEAERKWFEDSVRPKRDPNKPAG
ncbi:MAG: M56 family metallopeptidase [Pirellulaceae bacterium]